MEWVALIWLGFGVVLVLIELVVPGAIFGFVGAAALVTSALVHFGVISGLYEILMTFFVSSILFILVLRTLLLKLFPAEEQVHNTDETEDARGRVVDVTEAITPYRKGRIRYLDTHWAAASEEPIDAGQQAIIVDNDGNGWKVKPLEK